MYAGENNEIKVALIGCGGRGTDACIQALSTEGPMKLTAMADLFQDRVDVSLANISKEKPDRVDVPAERRFIGFDGYRRAIDSGVDGVILTTPPGFRPAQFEYAVEKGKHVFMEKPVATDAAGVRRVLAAGAAAREKNLSVVVGLQRRFDPRYREIVKRVRDGAIGELLYTRCYWDGGPLWSFPREPGQTELLHQVRNWYYFTWLCGDHIVEQHVHNLDVCNWVTGRTPLLASSHAGRQVRTGREFGQIYDHHAVEFTYEKRWDVPGVRMFSFSRQIAETFSSVSEHAYGTKGYADLSGFTIYDAAGERLWRYDHRRDPTLPEPGNPYQREHDELWGAVRSNTALNMAEIGAEATMTGILGRVAGYSGKLIPWEKALASEVVLAPDNLTDWDSPAPVMPNEERYYPIPAPGKWSDY